MKYQVDTIRQRIVSILEAEWPATLEGWDKISDEIRGIRRSPKSLFTRAVATIRLARECDIPSILPVAFYELFTRLTKQPSRYRVRLSTLSRDDLETITTGGHKINKFLMEASGSSHLDLDSWDCMELEGDECTTAVYQHWEIVLRDIACDGDPLTVLRENVKDLANDDDYNESAFGSDCRDMMGSRINNLRKDLFKNLSSFFIP